MDALHGELKNVAINVFAVKEEHYVMMLMSKYEKNEWVGKEKFWTISGDRITFKYLETVHNYYQNRYAVDSHNTRRQALIVLEDNWSKKH